LIGKKGSRGEGKDKFVPAGEEKPGKKRGFFFLVEEGKDAARRAEKKRNALQRRGREGIHHAWMKGRGEDGARSLLWKKRRGESAVCFAQGGKEKKKNA